MNRIALTETHDLPLYIQYPTPATGIHIQYYTLYRASLLFYFTLLYFLELLMWFEQQPY